MKSSTLTVLVCLLLSFPWFSNQETARSHKPEGQGSLVLGCWSAPRNLDTDYLQFVADLGFTHALYWRSPQISPEQWKRDLDRAQQLGIRLVFDSWQPSSIPGEWLDAVLNTACSHPAFGGVYAPDEPAYRLPLEEADRKPQVAQFRQAYDKLQRCGKGVLFHVDAVSADPALVRLFVPFSTIFGLDIYPYKVGVDWKKRVREATRLAVEWADRRPVWMVLQGHGREDWYDYATRHLHLKIPQETDPRPSASVLLEMAQTALRAGAGGLWWWSFELYDWKEPQQREFVLQFREVNHKLTEKWRTR